nr:phosphotransferase [uncultured Microbacterium sp.]
MSALDHALLESYLVRTRWFGGKGRPFEVTEARPLAGVSRGEGGPSTTVYLVTVDYSDDEGGREVYQVPLAGYPEVEERIGHAYVGSTESEGRTVHLYDAVHDREAMASWLDGFVAAEQEGVSDFGGLRFRRVSAGEPLDPEWRSSPLSGEQSNSSVRFDDTAIMKLFRKISPGVNPDIEIHQELTLGQSEHIAELYGWVEAEVDGGVLQLAMLQEFLRTAADGFELATGSVRTSMADLEVTLEDSGGDFAGEAARLGEAIAGVHLLLRDRFPAEHRGADATAALAAAMNERLDRALLIVPELEPYAPRLRAAYAAVAALDGLDVQRVHGDLHLGQTLRTARGWRVVDFEGEPGRPFDERALPDSPWRDVAGMLRSFDYAPGVVAMSSIPPAGGADAEQDSLRALRAGEWSTRARRCFLDAYVAAAGAGADALRSEGDDEGVVGLTGDQRVLLDAYVADKAVYETVYEKRNRPSWTAIPLSVLAEIGG